MKVKSESEVAQSCRTLCDPIDGLLPGSPVPRILQARGLVWGAIAFSTKEYFLSAGHVASSVLRAGSNAQNMTLALSCGT